MLAVEQTLSAKDLGRLRAAIIEIDSSARPAGPARRDAEVAGRFGVSVQSVVAYRATLARFAREALRRFGIDDRFETDLKSFALRLHNSRTDEQMEEVRSQAAVRAQAIGVSRGTLLDAAQHYARLLNGAAGLGERDNGTLTAASFPRRSKLSPDLRLRFRCLILGALVQERPGRLAELEKGISQAHDLSPFVLYALRAHVNKIFIHNACREHGIRLSDDAYAPVRELAHRVVNLKQRPTSRAFRDAVLAARRKSGLPAAELRKVIESYLRQFRE